jgi:hypothetical protein
MYMLSGDKRYKGRFILDQKLLRYEYSNFYVFRENYLPLQIRIYGDRNIFFKNGMCHNVYFCIRNRMAEKYSMKKVF